LDEKASTSMENLVIDRFRELSESGKQRLLDYADFLYQKEKNAPGISYLSLSEELQEFSKEKPTADAQKALQKLCSGIFESEEELASNHDFFLYGAPKRK
jgi:hypothetical protein